MDYSWEGSIISLSDSCTSSASSSFSTRPSSPVPTAALQQFNATSLESPNVASAPHAVGHQTQRDLHITADPTSPSTCYTTTPPPSPPAPTSRARDSPSPARPHRRQRTSTGGSIASDAASSHHSHSESGMTSSEDGEGEEEGTAESNLLMPSMRISLARMPAGSTRARELATSDMNRDQGGKLGRAHSAEGRTPSTTILLLGKTSQERQILARLLIRHEVLHPREGVESKRESSIAATDDGASEGDFGGDHGHMSASFLSTTSAGFSLVSERSSSSSSSNRLSSTYTDQPASAHIEAEHSVFAPLTLGAGLTFLHPTSIPDLTVTSLLPSSHATAILTTSSASLATALRTPLEQLERKLNPLYPTSRGLGELVSSAFSDEGGANACFMLMSSPPTSSEISLARTLSSLLPLFPILILPPNPSAGKRGKRQKTEALVQAVGVQLGRGGVRWVDGKVQDGGKDGGIFLLPHELFVSPTEVEEEGAEHSGPNSLSSSLELPLPPTPPMPASPALSSLPSSSRQSSRSHSNTSLRSASSTPSSSSANSSSRSRLNSSEGGDLKSLRELVQSVQGRESMRREKVDAFLEWREVEVAARGGSLEGLEVGGGLERWGETPWGNGSEGGAGAARRKEERELSFSRRVGERRAELQLARVANEIEHGQLSLHQQHHNPTSSSLLTDPTTPRCVERSALLLPPFSFPSPPPSSFPSGSLPSSLNSQTPLSPSLASSFASAIGVAPSGTAPLPLASGGVDPFHLPSLLHLVGLNIRLALLPVSRRSSSLPSTSTSISPSSSPSSEKAFTSPPDSPAQHHYHRLSVAGWTATLLSVGAVFLAGVVVGAGLGVGAAAGAGGEGQGAGWAGVGMGVACRGWRVGRW